MRGALSLDVAPLGKPVTLLRDVLSAVGDSIAKVLAAPAGLDLPVSSAVFYDGETLPVVAFGILLLVGQRADSRRVRRAVIQASANGYAAVVLKARGTNLESLLTLANTEGIAVLSAADSVDWRRVDRGISSAIRDLTPRAEVGHGGDLFSLANTVAAAAGGAVTIEDVAENVVAYSTLSGQPIDEIRTRCILARRTPDDRKDAALHRRVFSTRRVAHFPANQMEGNLPRAAKALYAGQEPVGSIWVIKNEDVRDEIIDTALTAAAGVAAALLVQARSSVDMARRPRGEALRALLEQDAVGSAALRLLGLRTTRPWSLTAFTLAPTPDHSELPLTIKLEQQIQAYATAFATDIVSVLIGRVVYALVPAASSEVCLRISSAAAAQAQSVIGHKVLVAVGTTASDRRNGAERRQETDEILLALIGDPDGPAVATLGKVYTKVQLARLRDSLADRSELHHPGVRAMRTYDHENQTTYAASLLAYFDGLGDIRSAARSLNLHPNTLRYRIARASALFDLTLDDPDSRFLLWLDLKVTAGGGT
jgi:hypothetical protein